MHTKGSLLRKAFQPGLQDADRLGPGRMLADRDHLQALTGGSPMAHFRQPFGWACAPGPLPAHSLPCPGCPTPVTPAAALMPPHHVQPLPASLPLPSLRQLLYRLIRTRHHCFSHLLVSCLPLPLETELPAGSRLGPFCSQLSLRPLGCLAHRTCSGVFAEGTCDPTRPRASQSPSGRMVQAAGSSLGEGLELTLRAGLRPRSWESRPCLCQPACPSWQP